MLFEPFTSKTLAYAKTTKGQVRGFRQNGIYAFLGIPYGECARWQTATPVKPWKGIKNALQFGPRMFPGAMETPESPVFTPWDSCGVAHEAYDYAEDALNLNIWTPSLDAPAKKPVIVWIHGGGFTSGSAMEMQAHYGENLSGFGDVVVVTVNHRLNIFGFLDVTPYGEQYANSGNCGISDLVLALTWVKENIANFGGDPNNVMIMGQSGGGQKVTCLMQTPAADGLFHKAVIMSGVAPYPQGKDPVVKEDACRSRAVTQLLLKKFGSDDIRVLEALTPEDLLNAYQSILPDLEKMGYDGRNWTAVTGDYYLGYPYLYGFTEHAKTIPVMVGSTFAEFPMMRILNKHSYTEQQQREILCECFPNQDVGKLIQLFQKAWPEKVLTDAIETSGRMDVRKSVIRFSDLRAETCTAATYTYCFDHDFPQEGGRGAWHCADIPLVFRNCAAYPENFHAGLLYKLEDAVCGSWAAFAHNSDPNNPHLGVHWPEYKAGECATMILSDTCEAKFDFDREFVNTRTNMQLEIQTKYTDFKQLVN